VAGIAPAIEIVDFARPSDDLAAILEHAIFHEAVVIGAELAPTALADLVPEHPLLFRNGELARRPDPAFAPRDLAAVLWHAARFLAQHGERLLAGDRLISGSFVQPLRVVPGDAIEVDFGRIGGVQVRLAPA
jgi:2-keto-4-pentenoate hydratase